MELAAILFSLFFAINIGASGAAASMGVAYGSGAVRKKLYALLICAAGVLSGAVIGGGEVVKTISSGIIPEQSITLTIVCIIIGAAALSLFTANVLGIPLSTSEVTVGAVVGVGVAYKVLFLNNLLMIVVFWILVPFVAFCFTFFVSKLFQFFKIEVKSSRKQKTLGIILLFAGFFEAFSGRNEQRRQRCRPVGCRRCLRCNKRYPVRGIFVALGALLLGGRVLETNGKKITKFSKGEGILLSGTGAGLVIISSVFGLPVPLAQVTSSSIIGIGMAKNGPNVFHKQVVRTMLKVWVVSPFLSLSISYLLVSLFLKGDYYSVFMMASVLLAAGGAVSLMKAIRKESRSVHEQGGGI